MGEATCVKLPNLYAQESIYEVLSDEKRDSFFVEYNEKEYKFGTDPELSSFTTSGAQAVATRAALQVDFFANNSFVSAIRLGIPLFNLKKYGIASAADVFDTKVLLGGRNGELKCIDFADKNTPQELHLGGHAIYTNLTQFFPSGKVALSSGMDFTIKLWNLEDDENTSTPVQSLRHQKGLVDDIAMIGRGRNLLSLCRADESLVQWEVSAPAVVNSWGLDGIQCLQLANDKTAFVGTNKCVKLIDFQSSQSNPAASLIGMPADHLAAAQHFLARAAHDMVAIYDIRNTRQTIHEWETPTPIVSLQSTQTKLYVQTEGSIYGINYNSGESEVLATDNKYASVFNDELVTVGHDIRKFPL